MDAVEAFNSVYISEVLPTSPADPRPGWIELYNGSSELVNLSGWFLSDNVTNVAKWRFPRVALLPGNYLLVYTLSDPRTNSSGRLHANFVLNQNGGYVGLSNPSSNVVSSLLYPEVPAGVSYGRVRGEPPVAGPLSEPSAGKPNQSNGAGFAPPVKFSRASGPFTVPFSLTLSSTSSNAVIRYTLNGRMPNGSSPVYITNLVITNTSCVRARAYEHGLLPGPPRSESYLLLSSNVMAFKSNLPIMIMDTLGSERAISARSSFVHISFYEPGNGAGSLSNGPSLTTRAGFHLRGSSSAGLPQPGFAVQFLDEFDHELNLSPLGLPASSDWVFYAPNAFDPVLIHNPFVHELSRQNRHWSPRTRFVEVYLAEHGGPVTARDYVGLYVLEEKIKIGKHRVAIDRLSPEDLEVPEVTGGYLLKFDRLGPGEDGFWAGGASMVYVEPREAVIQLPQRAAQRQYVKNYFDQFGRVLRGPKWNDPVEGYRAYIDVGSWIDFHLLEVLSGNVDAFSFSTYFYKPRGGKITYGPHWDFDRALGSIDGRDTDPRRWNTGRFFDGPWWGRLFTDPDFWQLWVDRWQELRRTTFSERSMFEIIDRLANEVREAQPRQARRWGLEPRWGTYQSEVDWMKQWLSERIRFIDGQLVQPPEANHAGGKVPPGFELTFKASAGSTIYVTLDGSDPRLPQGAISSNAVVYSGPIVLRSDLHVTARARNPALSQIDGPPLSTPWSAPLRADFVMGH